MADIIARALGAKAKKVADNAQQRIDVLPKGLNYKGAVNYRADLDNLAATIGDLYTVKYKGTSGTENWGAEFAYGTYEGTGQWIEIGANYDEAIAALQTGKQDTLISGSNVQTINGSSILGSGNLNIKTYQPFPNGQITGTLQNVVEAIMAFPGRSKGMAYLGDIAGSCTPFGYGNIECLVTFMTDGIAVLTAYSSNISPYHWEYNTAQSDYQWRPIGSNEKELPTKPTDLSKNYYLRQDKTTGALSWCESVPAGEILYTKNTTVAQTIGGLQQGLILTGRSLENIIERLVGAYIPPVFTNSSVSAEYACSNTRTGGTSYIMGDTVKLSTIKLTLNKGTDFDGLVSGSILQGNQSIYTLSSDDLNSLNTNGSVIVSFNNATYTFPVDQTSGSVTFKSQLSYRKKSYDPNDNIVINVVEFSINNKICSAQDEITYTKLYYGSLPQDSIITGLTPSGTVTYSGGTKLFSKKNGLGATEIVTTEDSTMGVFITSGALNDIQFMTASDIANWSVADKEVSYTRENGTTYSKTYKIYTNVIAVGSFTYQLS